MNISIAMATYNGAKYLQEQLDSFTAQTRLPDELVVCDDGSTDDTLKIIYKFADHAPFPVCIYENSENLGYADNFLKAASLCKGDWIAFSDQDDVWLPEKLEEIAKQCADDVLLIVHSAKLVDEELNSVGKRFPNIAENKTVSSLNNRPWWTPAGFTQCFSASLIHDFSWERRPTDFNLPDKMQAHDKWVYFLANSLGKVVYLERSLALYRRHENAVTGSYSNSFSTRLKAINGAGEKHYIFLSSVAKEYSETMAKIVNTSHTLHEKSKCASEYYDRLSDIYNLRSKVYSGHFSKISTMAFYHLCVRKAYGDNNGKGLGARAFFKDVVNLI